MRYLIVRQKRSTIGLNVKPNGEVEVRAPLNCPLARIEQCVAKHKDWLTSCVDRARRTEETREAPPRALRLLGKQLPVLPGGAEGVRLDAAQGAFFAPEGRSLRELTPELSALYRKLAAATLPPRVEYWAKAFDLHPQKVSVTNAAHRWGSCSAKGGLNFSWRLILASPKAVDAVVIHELMHLIKLNHSPEFRRLERENTPDYEACQQELKELAALLQKEGWM